MKQRWVIRVLGIAVGVVAITLAWPRPMLTGPPWRVEDLPLLVQELQREFRTVAKDHLSLVSDIGPSPSDLYLPTGNLPLAWRQYVDQLLGTCRQWVGPGVDLSFGPEADRLDVAISVMLSYGPEILLPFNSYVPWELRPGPEAGLFILKVEQPLRAEEVLLRTSFDEAGFMDEIELLGITFLP